MGSNFAMVNFGSALSHNTPSAWDYLKVQKGERLFIVSRGSKPVRRSVRNRFNIGSKSVRDGFANRVTNQFEISLKSVRDRFEIGAKSVRQRFRTEILPKLYGNSAEILPKWFHSTSTT